MSANQDKSQKIKFISSNLYQIHGDRKAADQQPVSVVQKMRTSSAVIKAEDLKQGATLQTKLPEVGSYIPTQFSPVKVTPALPAFVRPEKSVALDGLKRNLKTLNDLHARLRFMLKDLEQISKK